MNDEDYSLFQQAVTIVNTTGERHPAYEHFQLIRSHGNEDIELLFWIVATTPSAVEAQSLLNLIAARDPKHPSLRAARKDHQNKLIQAGVAALRQPPPVIRCPYCGTEAPVLVKRKITPVGWAVFVVLLIFVATILFCWLGLLIQEEYRVCSHCGIRLG